MFELTPLIESLKPEMLTALSSTAKQAVTDGYQGLKGLISKKYGDNSDISQALQNVENKPESQARQDVLNEEWKAVYAHEDPEIASALATLKEVLDKERSQSNQGDHNTLADSINGNNVNGNRNEGPGTQFNVGGDLSITQGKKNTSIPK